MCPRVCFLSAAVVAMILRSSPARGLRTRVHFKWQSNCDYVGGDLKSVAAVSSECGHLCVNEAACTHWSWTDFNGGTCWLKQSQTAFISRSAGQGVCGYVTDRVSIAASTPVPSEQTAVQLTLPMAQNPVQNSISIKQKPIQKADLPMSWTFLNEKVVETPITMSMKQNPVQNSISIKQKPIQMANLPMSWTFSNEKVLETSESTSFSNGLITTEKAETPIYNILQTSDPIKQNPVQSKQNPVQNSIPMDQNPVQNNIFMQNRIPIKQNPAQKTDRPTSYAFSFEKASETPEPTSFKNGLTSADNAEMLATLNSYRTDRGLAALAIDNRLMAAALAHSQYQATHCVMQHEGIDGSSPGDRMKSQNYIWSYSAENVAAGQANVSEVMTSWWNSEHHRENILRTTVTQVGFALVSNDACEYKRYWTQDFGAEQTV